jgi:hypothetical protein
VKIGRIEDGEDIPAFERDAYVVHEFTNGRKCVLVRCRSDPVGLLLHLLARAKDPIGLLYVLLVPRKGKNPAGRHQSPSITVADAVEFLRRFGEFLRSDGRHELWIHCPDYLDMVYDHHERIWLYGDIDSTALLVEGFGIQHKPLEPIPVPHSHHYHERFDDMEDEIMTYWDWHTTALHEGDGE